MSETIPKLLELKFLKRMSKIIILPMIVSSWIAQFGLNVNFMGLSIGVNPSAETFFQILQLFFSLSAKILLIGAPLWILHNFLPIIHNLTYSNRFHRSLISICPIIPITFGFIGFFKTEKIPVLTLINDNWYYTAFIFGFYLMSVEDDIEQPFLNSEEDRSYPRRNFPLAYKDDLF